VKKGSSKLCGGVFFVFLGGGVVFFKKKRLRGTDFYFAH